MRHIAFIENVPVEQLGYESLVNFSFLIRTEPFPELHDHVDYWECLIVLDGAFEHTINGKSYDMKRNDCCLIRPKDRHFFNKNRSSLYINLIIKDSFFASLLRMLHKTIYDRLLESDGLRFALTEMEVNEIKQYSSAALRIPPNNVQNTILLKNITTLQIINILLKHIVSFPTDYPAWLSAINSHVLLEGNIDLTVSDLCEITGYSKVHLNRLFKNHLQMTPLDYIHQHKIHYAQQLLNNTDYSVSAIAMLCGFSSPSHFYKMFKAHTGLSPIEYKQRSLFSPLNGESENP